MKIPRQFQPTGHLKIRSRLPLSERFPKKNNEAVFGTAQVNERTPANPLGSAGMPLTQRKYVTVIDAVNAAIDAQKFRDEWATSWNRSCKIVCTIAEPNPMKVPRI